MTKKIIVEIVFNAFGFTDDRFKKGWIDHRMSLFMKYAAQSLKKQTSQDFIALVRYEDVTEPLIKDAINKYEKLPENIKFVNKKEHMEIIKENCKRLDDLYLARLDSDDLFHKDYIKLLHQYKPKKDTEVLISQNGYLYDSVTKRLAPYYHISPQFYVFLYRTEDYLAGKRYKPGGHGNVIKVLNYEILPGTNYVNLIHDKNVSNKLLGNKSSSNEWVKVGVIIADKPKVNTLLSDFM